MRALLNEGGRRDAKKGLIHFIRRVAPWFVIEEIHILIARYLEDLVRGKHDRLMIFMPPRAGKSMIASIFLPAWYMGLYPARKVMQASYGSELATDFGRQVRTMVADDDYQEIFPGVELQPDNKAAGRWGLTGGGVYVATGTTGGISGKGFHLGIVDDPLSEQDAHSEVAKLRVQRWWGPGFYTRRQPEQSAILVMSTRWALNDLPGYLLQKAREDSDADQWTVLDIPAILDDEAAKKLNGVTGSPLLTNDQRGRFTFRKGDSFSPRRWPLQEIMRQRANMSGRDFQALYQQSPVEEEGNILKRQYWRKWPGSDRPGAKPPKCEFVISVYDTAFEEGEENDYTARTTWGIFWHEEDPPEAEEHVAKGKYRKPLPPGRYCCILLERFKDRVEFPELRRLARAHYEEFRPDLVMIEKKASGHSLIQELRRRNIPLRALKADRSKLARAHAAAVVLEDGCVWYMDRTWAHEVIEDCAAATFMKGSPGNDIPDTAVYAWLHLRRHFHIELKGEMEDDPEPTQPARPYG